MSYEQENKDYDDQNQEHHDGYYDDDDYQPRSRRNKGRYRDEVYSKRVPAGKRTYFFDVKTTRSGEDFFITITESKRLDETRYEKHKIFLYKEDFGKFVTAMHEVVQYIQNECLPDYDFRGMPEIPNPPEEEAAYRDEQGDY